MAVILIPLFIIGLVFFGLTVLFGLVLFLLVERFESLRFLRGDKGGWLIFILSAVTAAIPTFGIWTYFRFLPV